MAVTALRDVSSACGPSSDHQQLHGDTCTSGERLAEREQRLVARRGAFCDIRLA
jgi:hypothetical protein